MEAKFDNANNVLTANVRIAHDQSILYTISTNQTAWKREKTYLKDANPALGESPTAGVIHWQEKMFEVHGVRRPISELRRKPKGFHMLSKERYWRWSSDRKEYTVSYKDEKEWQVLHNNEVVASLSVPYRPKLFGKMRPVVLKMSACVLERDEAFILLVLMYSEAVRQDRMNASGGWQA